MPASTSPPSSTTALIPPLNSTVGNPSESASAATLSPAPHAIASSQHQQNAQHSLQHASGSKRKRVALACNTCRVRKSKCDGIRPKCSNCKDLDFDCVYAQSASSSNTIVAKDYIGQLESRLLAVERILTTQLERQETRSHRKRQKRSNSAEASSVGSRDASGDERERSRSSSSTSDDERRAAARATRKRSKKSLKGGNSTQFDNTMKEGVGDGVSTTGDGFVKLKQEKLEDDEDALGGGAKEVVLDGMGTLGSGVGDEEDYGYFGPSSNIAFISHVTRALASSTMPSSSPSSSSSSSSSSLSSFPQSHWRPHSSHLQAIRSSSLPPLGDSQELNSHTPDTLNIYVLPPKTQVLHYTDLYFQNTNILFPYLHQPTFLAQYHEAEANGFTGVRRTWLALLNIVMAMGCKANSSSFPSSVNNPDDEIADTFYLRAMGIVQNSFLKLASLEAVQMLLLMSHYLQSTRRPVQCWATHGLAVRVALQLGLQSNRALSRFGLLERELRKRAWYGCVLLDKTLCMTFGRPTSIGPYAYELELPLDVEDVELTRGVNTPHCMRSGGEAIEVEEAFRSLSQTRESCANPDGSRRTAVTTTSFFIMAIKLYKILGRIIDSLYNGNLGDSVSSSVVSSSHSATSASPTFSDFSHLSEIESMLSQWRAQLPLPLSIISANDIPPGGGPPSKFWRQSIILSLRYYNTRSLLHRPFVVKGLSEIRGTGPSSSRGGGGGTTASFEGEFYWKFGWPAVRTCTESAGEIVSIVYRLLSDRRKELLAWWWFSLYYTFNASLVIISKLVIVRQIGGLVIRPGDGVSSKARSTPAKDRSICEANVRKGTMIMPYEVEGVDQEGMKILVGYLEMASSAIDVLAEGNRIAERLKEFMKGLMKVVVPLARVGGSGENEEEEDGGGERGAEGRCSGYTSLRRNGGITSIGIFKTAKEATGLTESGCDNNGRSKGDRKTETETLAAQKGHGTFTECQSHPHQPLTSEAPYPATTPLDPPPSSSSAPSSSSIPTISSGGNSMDYATTRLSASSNTTPAAITNIGPTFQRHHHLQHRAYIPAQTGHVGNLPISATLNTLPPTTRSASAYPEASESSIENIATSTTATDGHAGGAGIAMTPHGQPYAAVPGGLYRGLPTPAAEFGYGGDGGGSGRSAQHRSHANGLGGDFMLESDFGYLSSLLPGFLEESVGAGAGGGDDGWG